MGLETCRFKTQYHSLDQRNESVTLELAGTAGHLPIAKRKHAI